MVPGLDSDCVYRADAASESALAASVVNTDARHGELIGCVGGPTTSLVERRRVAPPRKMPPRISWPQPSDQPTASTRSEKAHWQPADRAPVRNDSDHCFLRKRNRKNLFRRFGTQLGFHPGFPSRSAPATTRSHHSVCIRNGHNSGTILSVPTRDLPLHLVLARFAPISASIRPCFAPFPTTPGHPRIAITKNHKPLLSNDLCLIMHDTLRQARH